MRRGPARGGRRREGSDGRRRQFHGHAFALLRHAEAFFDMHLALASRIVPGRMRREDKPQYPLEALREALVNAICHRDYSSCCPRSPLRLRRGSSVHVEVTQPRPRAGCDLDHSTTRHRRARSPMFCSIVPAPSPYYSASVRRCIPPFDDEFLSSRIFLLKGISHHVKYECTH